MKKNVFSVAALLLFSVALWSCSDSSDNDPEKDLSLEQSLDVKAGNLTKAVTEISKTKGFEIITMNDSQSTKVKTDGNENDDSRFSASIKLEDVKGIYDYSPNLTNETTVTKFGYRRAFKRTEASENFIIRLPKEKATNPWKLYMQEEGDVELTNDFVITTSDFLYEYSGGFKFNYILDSKIDVENEPAGELAVKWSVSEDMNYEYESEYKFTNAYSVRTNFSYGKEMIRYAYGLENNDKELYKEEIEIKKSEDSQKAEHLYSLSIENIQLKKTSESEMIQVYRDGSLEKNAVVEVLNKNGDSVDVDVAFCRGGRDLKISFEDNTSVVLSELLGDTLPVLDELFKSMSKIYFTEHLVNKIALEAYYTNKNTTDTAQ